MVVQDIAVLIKILEKSGLIKGDALEQIKEEAQAKAKELDKPEKLARYWIQKGFVTRWQAAQLLNGKGAFFLGKYKLLKLIGTGGMGRVFLAEHTIMNRKVALKVISKEYCDNPAAVKRFQAEARAIATLNHPNIVQAYNFESEGNRYYIVMEYVDGESLEERIKKAGPLPIEETISCIRQAAKALRHAHQRKMIHCDIKPTNLLVNDKNQIKILDMGIARLQESSKSQMIKNNSSPDVLGTVDFMAPEMAINSPEIDARTDIYSLGCTLYYLLTGSVPYPSATLAERILDHQESPPKDPRELREDTPDDLAEICLKMEAKLPEDRYQNMQEVLDALAESFPESGDLNMSDSSGGLSLAVEAQGPSASNASSQNGQSWAGSLDFDKKTEPKKSKESAASSQSFDFTASSDSSEQAHKSSSEGLVPPIASTGGKKTSKKKKGGKAAAPAFKFALPAFLTQMSGRTKLIISASVLGVVVLTGIIVGIVAWLSGDSDKPVTAANQPAVTNTLAPTTLAPTPAAGELTDLGAPATAATTVSAAAATSATQPSATGADVGSSTPAAAPAVTVAGTAAVPTAQAAAPAGTAAEAGAPAATAPAATGSAATGSAATAPASASTDAAATAPSDPNAAAAPVELTEEEKAKKAEEEKKAAEDKAKADAQAKEKAEAEAKAKADAEAKAKEESEKKKAEEAKKNAENLFKEAPTSVELPNLKTNEATTLITINTDEAWSLLLLGGTVCGPKNFSYEIEQTEADPAKAEWKIKETAPGKGEPTVTEVAKIWREESDLKFQYLETANIKSAGAIRNTFLQIEALGKSHKLALRAPVVIADSSFDFFRKGLQIKPEIRDLPGNLDNVKFSFIGIDGFDKKEVTIEPVEPQSITSKTRPAIKFIYLAQGNNLTYPLGIEAMINPKTLVIKFSAGFLDQRLGQAFQQFVKNKVILNMKKIEAEKKLSSLTQQEKDAKGEKTKIHNEMEQIKASLWAFNFMEKVETAPPKLQFEIFNDIDGEKMVLITTAQ